MSVYVYACACALLLCLSYAGSPGVGVCREALACVCKTTADARARNFAQWWDHPGGTLLELGFPSARLFVRWLNALPPSATMHVPMLTLDLGQPSSTHSPYAFHETMGEVACGVGARCGPHLQHLKLMYDNPFYNVHFKIWLRDYTALTGLKLHVKTLTPLYQSSYSQTLRLGHLTRLTRLDLSEGGMCLNTQATSIQLPASLRCLDDDMYRLRPTVMDAQAYFDTREACVHACDACGRALDGACGFTWTRAHPARPVQWPPCPSWRRSRWSRHRQCTTWPP